MEINSECFPCFLKQVLNVCDVIKLKEEERKEIMREVLSYLSTASYNMPPPYLSRDVYNIISKITGVSDPYEEIKRESNKFALSLYPKLKERVKKAEDPLFEAVRLAIIGNIIDFGAAHNFSLEDIKSFESIPIGINHYDYLKKDINQAKSVLYIADNAGEVVFDRILVEELAAKGKKVFFAVRSKPIINDATFQDAVEAGIHHYAEIIDSGSDAPGILLNKVTERFKHLFRDCEVVISKGQGNFETLEDIPRRVYFLLRTKCDVVASTLGTNLGDIVILKGGRECTSGLLLL